MASEYSPDTIAANIFAMLQNIKDTALYLKTKAEESIVDAEVKLNDAAPNRPDATAFPWTPTVYEPNVYIPQFADTSLDVTYFEASTEKVMENLKDEFTRFFDVYFPDECNYMASAQSWLCNVISNNGIGIDAATENLIYERDKDRIEGEYLKGMDDASAVWASRGFNMPGGALLATQRQLRTAADKQHGESSRTLAIKHFELRIDMVKFAVDKVLSLRVQSIDAGARYLGALATGMDVYTKAIVTQQDAQAKLISAASEYYKSRIAVQELVFKAEATEAELKDKSAQRFHEQSLKLIEMSANASVDGARILGTQAAAALNALHTGANMGLNVSL